MEVIMATATSLGVSPETLTAAIRQEHATASRAEHRSTLGNARKSENIFSDGQCAAFLNFK